MMVNRYGYRGDPDLIQPPGPYAPLQDEPGDPDAITGRRETKTVLVPMIESMKEYIIRHHRVRIINALNRAFREGGLPVPSGCAPAVLTAANTTIDDMEFWRIDTKTLLADVTVHTRAFSKNRDMVHGYYQELYVDMREGMEFRMGDAGTLETLPDRGLWKLTRYLIPIMSKEQIELEAERLLLRYCPNALADRSEHSPWVLAAMMGLNIETAPLYNADRTLSMIYFCEGTALVQDDPAKPGEKRLPPYEKTIRGNTILINTRAVHKDQCQLEIYHECIHYDWHYMFYRLQDMHNNDINRLRTRRVTVRETVRNQNPLSWMEWQASRGSYALMMPRSMMRPEVEKRMAQLSSHSLHGGMKYEIIGRSIAYDFQLPKFRVRARLIQLSQIAAQGALNFVDGHYITPFAFSPENGGGNYTFVATRENIFDEYCASEDFRKMIDSGKYIFTDGHLCVNDERYVHRTEFGLQLTPWANEHVDQCCLRFVNVYEPAGVAGYRFGRLNSDEAYNRHYISIAMDGVDLNNEQAFDRMNELLNGMPPAFPEALAYLMERRSVTEEKMEEITGISVSTISRLRRKEKNTYAVDQVMAICVGLHLPPVISRELFHRAGIILRANRQHRAYQMILDCLYMDSIQQVQDFLKRQGCEPLKLKAS